MLQQLARQFPDKMAVRRHLAVLVLAQLHSDQVRVEANFNPAFLQSQQPIRRYRPIVLPEPARLAPMRVQHFDVSWCEQKRTAVVSKGGQFVVSKTGRASKSGRFACSAWPLNAGRAHPTEKTVREGLTSAPPNLRKQRTSPGLVRLACPCRFKLQSEKSQGVWGTASPSSPQAFNQNGLSAFANYTTTSAVILDNAHPHTPAALLRTY